MMVGVIGLMLISVTYLGLDGSVLARPVCVEVVRATMHGMPASFGLVHAGFFQTAMPLARTRNPLPEGRISGSMLILKFCLGSGGSMLARLAR